MLREHKLDNGLTVLFEPIEDPVTAIWIGIRAGTLSDPEPLLGITHLLEHLCHGQSQSRTFDEITDVFESLGNYHNAGTGYEYSCFHANILNEDLETALRLYADILRPNVSQERLDNERSLIKQEIAEKWNNVAKFLNSQLTNTHWRGQPAARPRLGTLETLARITPEAVHEHNRFWFRPQSMVVSCAGGTDEETLLRVCRESIGRWPDEGEAPMLPPAATTVPEQLREIYRRPGLTQSRIGLSASLGETPYEDEPSIGFISAILDRRLFRELRKGGFTYHQHVSSGSFAKQTVLFANANTDPTGTEEVVARMRMLLEHPAPFTDRELVGVKKRHLISLARTMKAPYYVAESAGKNWILGYEQESLAEYVSRARAVTVSDLANVLTRHPIRVQTEVIVEPEL